MPGADEGAGDGLFTGTRAAAWPPAALDDLAALVDHGLVQPLDPIMDEPRYRMLETVRQFGQEQLAASGEEEEVRRRHLIYFVALAERLAERICCRRQSGSLPGWTPSTTTCERRWRGRRRAGRRRWGCAWRGQWAVTGPSAATCARARAGLERALGWGSPTATPERARALSGLGWLSRFQGDSDRAEAAFGEALRTAAAAGRG